jgi:metal-dependent amidase/aminoacylase/carboxypeptidase family protein
MLSGTIRTYSDNIMQLIMERMETITKHIAAAMNCEAHIEFGRDGKAVINNDEVVSRTRYAFEKLGKTELDFFYERSMASEDVGEFMTDIPGMYFFLGCGNEEQKLNYALHHPNFNMDEDVLPHGVALMSAAVAEYLIQEG